MKMEQCQVIDSGGRGVASQAVKIEDFVKQEMPQEVEEVDKEMNEDFEAQDMPQQVEDFETEDNETVEDFEDKEMVEDFAKQEMSPHWEQAWDVDLEYIDMHDPDRIAEKLYAAHLAYDVISEDE